MTYIETDRSNYYLQKFVSLLFGGGFFIGGLLTLLNGGTVTINDVPTKATLANTSPVLFLGGAFMVLFLWICFNYFRVALTENNVEKKRFNGSKKYDWADFEEIREMPWLWRGTIYRFKPKNEQPFYAHADRARITLNNPFKTRLHDMTYFKSKMGDLIRQKKKNLNI